LEGTQNARAAFGYNRDGKQGKRQIVLGLLGAEDGQPVSREIFPGKTPAPQTLAAQSNQGKARLGVQESTFVGDRGMIKGQQSEDLAPQGRHDITASTNPPSDPVRRIGTLHMDRFAQEGAEVLADEGVRYGLRRHPVRAHAVREARHAQWVTLQALGAKPQHDLTAPPRAKAQRAVPKLVARVTPLRIADGVELPVVERPLPLTVHEEAPTDAAKRDGGSVLQTDLTPAHAHKESVQARSTDLAAVAQAFRTCNTAPRAVRPSFLRRDARPRAQAFVVMLACQRIHSLPACWSALDCAVEEGRHALTTLCLVEGSPTHAPS